MPSLVEEPAATGEYDASLFGSIDVFEMEATAAAGVRESDLRRSNRALRPASRDSTPVSSFETGVQGYATTSARLVMMLKKSAA